MKLAATTSPALRLKTRQMVLLLALDERRNIHQAALQTAMSQPAASKMLKDIETQLGVPLFERLARGIQPTLYGETMIRHVRMAVTTLAEGQASVAALQAGLLGRVSLGTIVTPSMTLVPQAILRVRQQAPGLAIGVEVDTSDALVERLRSGKLDVLLARIAAQDDGADLLYQDLLKETVCAVVRPGHPMLSRTDLSLEALSGAEWILSARGSILRHRVDMMFRQRKLPPPGHVVETTAMTLTLSLLQQTDFLHVMPTEIARYYVQTGELAVLPITLPIAMDTFGIVTQRHRLLSPGALVLLNALKSLATDQA